MGNLHASYLLQQQRSPGVRIPVLITPDLAAPVVAAWAREHRPDVLISSSDSHYESLLEGLGAAARSCRFLNLNANPRSDMAGIDQGHDKVGEHAMTALHLKLVHRETGIPKCRELTLIDGVWKEGRGEWHLPRRASPDADSAQPPALDIRQTVDNP